MLIDQNLQLKKFLFCVNAVVVRFQQDVRLVGLHDDANSYYISKHKHYRYKSEVLVMLIDLCIYPFFHWRSIVSNISITRKSLIFYQKVGEKCHDGKGIDDNDSDRDEGHLAWSSIEEKAYQGTRLSSER